MTRRFDPLRRSLAPFGAPLLALLCAAVVAACGATPENAPDAAEAGSADVIAFVGANVIPMDEERVLSNHTVLVRDGVIAEIGPADQVSVPSGATRVDATGKYLIPGLAELHAHIPVGDAETIERTLFLYVAGGVTTIRGMLGSPEHLELRERVAAGELIGPRIYTSGPAVSGNSTPNPEAAVRLVEEQHAAGYDLLKVQTGVSREAFDAMAEAAHRLGIPFAGHVPEAVGFNRALEARYASIDHLDSYVQALAGYPDGNAPNPGFFGLYLLDRVDEGKIPELVAATVASGVWNVPTLTLVEHLANPIPPEELAQRPEMAYMPPQTIQQWIQRKRGFQNDPQFTPERGERFIQLRRQLVKALHDAGAPIALGSDAPQWWNVPGFSARRELELMVAAGLTPFQALAAGTRNAARLVGAEGEWGVLAVGQRADMVLLDANPLADITNVWQQAGVMVGGRWLPREELDARLNEIAASFRE